MTNAIPKTMDDITDAEMFKVPVSDSIGKKRYSSMINIDYYRLSVYRLTTPGLKGRWKRILET